MTIRTDDAQKIQPGSPRLFKQLVHFEDNRSERAQDPNTKLGRLVFQCCTAGKEDS